MWESLVTMAALIYCFVMVFHRWESSDGFWEHYFVRNSCHNGCIGMVYRQCVSSDGLWNYLRKSCYNSCTDMVSPQVCLIRSVLRTLFCEKPLSQWLHWYDFSPVAALIWFLNSVCSQMAFETTIFRENFVTIVELIYFIPNVWSQMTYKIIIQRKSLANLSTLGSSYFSMSSLTFIMGKYIDCEIWRAKILRHTASPLK